MKFMEGSRSCRLCTNHGLSLRILSTGKNHLTATCAEISSYLHSTVPTSRLLWLIYVPDIAFEMKSERTAISCCFWLSSRSSSHAACRYYNIMRLRQHYQESHPGGKWVDLLMKLVPSLNPEAPRAAKHRLSPCDFCLKPEYEYGETEQLEDMLTCAECERRVHPSCQDFTDEMTDKAKRYK